MTQHHKTTRRAILKAGGAFAAASLLSPMSALAATPPAGMLPASRAKGQGMPRGDFLPASPPRLRGDGPSVGIAIMGLGGYALRQIMPSLVKAKRVHLAALVSGNPEKAATVAAAYDLPSDAVYSYETFERIASDDRVDAVYNIMPTGLHAAWVKKAFDAGKHVLCEKPMAINGPECDYMLAVAKAANRKLMMGYRCYFEPYNVQAMKLVADGTLGQLQSMTGTHEYRSGPTTPEKNWRHNRALAGGGPLEDYGVYGVNGAFYLLPNETPASITASTIQPKDDPRFREIFSHVKSQIRFASGIVADLSTSYNDTGGNELSVIGAGGSVRMRPATSYYRNQLVLTRKGEDDRRFSLGESALQFERQMDHFADVVLEDAKIMTPGEMGRRDCRIIDAIYRAAETGSTVALNPDATMKG